MSWQRIAIDLEANNLLKPLMDFSSMPYKLKKEAQLWCISLRCIDTKQSVLLVKEEYINYVAPEDDPIGSKYNKIPKRILSKDMLKLVLKNCIVLIGHNIIAYDLPYLMLYGILDYKINFPNKINLAEKYIPTLHKVFDNDVDIIDTLIVSKLFNPDRQDSFGKHSLEAFGLRTGHEKIDFNNFSQYTPSMGVYCDGDTLVSVNTYEYLMAEQDFEKWRKAYDMEIKLVDLTLKQEYFGFKFDVELAQKALVELDQMLKEREGQVLPHLPKKKMTQADINYYTPPETQFKSNGEPSAHVCKFSKKINNFIDSEIPYTVESATPSIVIKRKKEVEIYNSIKHTDINPFIITKSREDDESALDYYLLYKNKKYKLPFNEALETETDAAINDHNTVKGFLIESGWIPSEWKERNLILDSKKKKIESEKVIKAIQRYAKETLESPFKSFRLEYLNLTEKDDLEKYLLKKYEKSPNKPLKVITTPPLRVGATKDLCPNLEKLSKQEGNDFIKAIVEWHTYAHRRNSIAGGGIDEDGEPTKGFLSFVREDGRVSTPADTLGASTFRMQHREIANIPRTTSLYGETMRELFGCGEGYAQLGFDFAS